MTEILVAAVGVVLVLEGILPFIAPGFWRNMFRRFTELSDGQVRFAGLASMLLGLLWLFITS